MTSLRQINHVTLIVGDLEAARGFYEGMLGLEPLPSFNATRGKTAHKKFGKYHAAGSPELVDGQAKATDSVHQSLSHSEESL